MEINGDNNWRMWEMRVNRGANGSKDSMITFLRFDEIKILLNNTSEKQQQQQQHNNKMNHKPTYWTSVAE